MATEKADNAWRTVGDRGAAVNAAEAIRSDAKMTIDGVDYQLCNWPQQSSITYHSDSGSYTIDADTIGINTEGAKVIQEDIKIYVNNVSSQINEQLGISKYMVMQAIRGSSAVDEFQKMLSKVGTSIDSLLNDLNAFVSALDTITGAYKSNDSSSTFSSVNTDANS